MSEGGAPSRTRHTASKETRGEFPTSNTREKRLKNAIRADVRMLESEVQVLRCLYQEVDG
jgi:hypothetical protein